MSGRDHDHLSNPILSERSKFYDPAHKSYNLNVRQQYFLPVSMQNSKYDLKFILPNRLSRRLRMDRWVFFTLPHTQII